MTDEQESVRALLALDACSAWRADVEALGGAELLRGDSEERWALWLAIATMYARISRLRPDLRASYAKSSVELWQFAGVTIGEEGFAQVADVMSRWAGGAPALKDFRSLLWVASQLEGDGALRTALVCLRSLIELVPANDIRAAYATAQSGRALRTLGLIDESAKAFSSAETTANRSGDSWLRVRIKLGVGVLLHSRGNYPSARTQFSEALAMAGQHRDLLIGAHLGVVLTAQATRDLDTAFEHGWMALELASGDLENEVEALSLLANLSLEVGHYAAALRASRAALARHPKRHHRHFLIRAVVGSALGVHDDELLEEFLPLLQADVLHTPNPWDRAEGHRVLADVFMYRSSFDSACEHYLVASSLAVEHGFNEIRWNAENGLMSARRGLAGEHRGSEHASPPQNAQGVTRTVRSVLQSLEALQLTAT